MENKEISIIIPLYNEAGNVSPVYSELMDVLKGLDKDYEIIFVDDGSTDNTFNELLKIEPVDSEIKILKFRRNHGQTAAIKAGFDHALGAKIITMDGDLQNDPKDIPRLLEKIGEGYDVVSGWRADRKDPFTKRIPSKFSNWLHRRLMGMNLHDSGCTLKAYKREAIKDLELYGETHRYIPALIASKGFKVGEVKVNHRPRRSGRTKYNSWRLLKGFLDLVNIKYWSVFSSRPLHFFGILGLGQLLLGFFIGFYLLFVKFIQKEAIGNRPLLLLSVLLILMGVQLLTFGLMSEILVKIYYGNKSRSYELEYCSFDTSE